MNLNIKRYVIVSLVIAGMIGSVYLIYVIFKMSRTIQQQNQRDEWESTKEQREIVYQQQNAERLRKFQMAVNLRNEAEISYQNGAYAESYRLMEEYLEANTRFEHSYPAYYSDIGDNSHGSYWKRLGKNVYRDSGIGYMKELWKKGSLQEARAVLNALQQHLPDDGYVGQCLFYQNEGLTYQQASAALEKGAKSIKEFAYLPSRTLGNNRKEIEAALGKPLETKVVNIYTSKDDAANKYTLLYDGVSIVVFQYTSTTANYSESIESVSLKKPLPIFKIPVGLNASYLEIRRAFGTPETGSQNLLYYIDNQFDGITANIYFNFTDYKVTEITWSYEIHT